MGESLIEMELNTKNKELAKNIFLEADMFFEYLGTTHDNL
jgi:hypothetical protein